MKKIFALFGIVLLTACASVANYEKILNTWIGLPVDNLVSSWGPPQSAFDLSNGGKVIEYANARNVLVGGLAYSIPQTTYHSGKRSEYTLNGGVTHAQYSGKSTTHVQKITPVRNLSVSCKTRFTVNNKGIITKWSWEGNDCQAFN